MLDINNIHSYIHCPLPQLIVTKGDFDSEKVEIFVFV